ncbi:MAG TPA: GreA/GreB family elongation factor [Gaiella sp.]|nr:GreA/GreB family elongation factor [Gaiella sp.]
MTTLPFDDDTTVLISAEGHVRLSRELDMLRSDARRDLTERLREAREDGDLEDNPVLGDLLEEQAQLEQRISLLEARLRSAEIVLPVDDGRAGIGTLVRVRDLVADSTHEYELVGTLESDVVRGRVSVEAPVGRALVGRLPGERLDVDTPRGVMELEVVDVRPASDASLEREAA